MNKEERATYQREYRKRRKQPVNDSVNVNSLRKLEESVEALAVRVIELEETVSKLAAAQSKVSVVPGISVPRLAKLINPLSREANATLKAMPYLNRGDDGH